MLIAVRFALYLDLMLVFGLPLFLLYTFCRAGGRASGSIISSATLPILSLTGATLSALGLLLLAAAMSDEPVFQLDHETLSALLGTAIGTAGKIRIAVLLVVLPLGLALKSRPHVRWATQASLGAVALGSLAWTGHGAADEGPGGLAHLTADIVHLLAAGVWIGALAGLLIVLWRARAGCSDQQDRTVLAHRALVGFGTVGTFSVGLIILTGLVNSWFLVGVGNVSALVSSAYGRLLILKLLIFAGMLGLATVNRFRLTPAIETSLGQAMAATSLRSIKVSVTVETSLGLVVLALVAWLGTLAPPISV